MSNRIYIPTLGRIGKQRTYDSLPKHIQERAVLVTSEEEAEAQEMLGYPVLVCDAHGIAATRQWVLDQHDVEQYGGKLYMFDDDLRFARRRTDDPTKLSKLAPGDSGIGDMVEELDNMLDAVPMVGITYRSGANRRTETYLPGVRIHNVWGTDVEVLRAEGIRIDRLQFMEDFDLALQLLTKGYPTLMLNSYTQDDGESNAPGGCSITRSGPAQTEACFGLWENFPDFVKLREAKGWTGMGETRTDVTVQWAKAYAYGTAYRETAGLEPFPYPDLAELEARNLV